jgi:hypothetical protein
VEFAIQTTLSGVVGDYKESFGFPSVAFCAYGGGRLRGHTVASLVHVQAST